MSPHDPPELVLCEAELPESNRRDLSRRKTQWGKLLSCASVGPQRPILAGRRSAAGTNWLAARCCRTAGGKHSSALGGSQTSHCTEVKLVWDFHILGGGGVFESSGATDPPPAPPWVVRSIFVPRKLRFQWLKKNRRKWGKLVISFAPKKVQLHCDEPRATWSLDGQSN